MKTIAQFVSDRIQSLADLKDALQIAMQLSSPRSPLTCARSGRSMATRAGSAK
jgi:hypothetical protein